MTFSDDELDRYARHIVLPQFGGAGQQRLKSSSVLLVGAGGIGAGALPSLAGAGVGRIHIVDDDQVDVSNLARQPLYRSEDVGRSKAELAARFAAERNPHIEIVAVDQRVDEDNAENLLSGHDLVIDGSDNFRTRLIVSDMAVKLGLPLVSGAAAQFQGQAALLTGQPCYRCFVGEAFDSDDCDNCAELGVLGALTGTMGHFAAMLAIRHLAGIGPSDAGTLHLFDGVRARWKAITLVADPACRACGTPG
ncbi:HesA/MoeB/ThiF family protein [Sphingomicrobium lutaoense]|uniref:Adenylyltransferase/sulfurtransferase n=1 Tax=Sphingomicrobium lutaoense TaxID=515949 RepID=A0A839YY28_9SPHN|nr:HesA/MoeB/ThiF family protein [Sphingomicrobium lutaoense]MBB3763926.1 adenylyltransferase/sulfurtransferase [Sphingomicrobium lutaoense]